MFPERTRFADQVILLNPAIEAIRLKSLISFVRRNGAQPDEDAFEWPILTIITSRGDYFTREWFRFGQMLALPVTVGRHRNGQFWEYWDSVGHHDPFVTHTLKPIDSAPSSSLEERFDACAWLQNSGQDRGALFLELNSKRSIRFCGTVLTLDRRNDVEEETQGHILGEHILVIKAHRGIIKDHQAWATPGLLGFISDFVELLGTLEKGQTCKEKISG